MDLFFTTYYISKNIFNESSGNTGTSTMITADNKLARGANQSNINFKGATDEQKESESSIIEKIITSCYSYNPDSDACERIHGSKMNYKDFDLIMRYSCFGANIITDWMNMCGYVTTTSDSLYYPNGYSRIAGNVNEILGTKEKPISTMIASMWNVEPIWKPIGSAGPYFEWSDEYKI